MTVILVESKNDDTFCTQNLRDFNEYTNTIFRKITNLEFIPTLNDPKIIPKIMNVGNYFLIKKSNFDEKVFNSSISVSLYKIEEKETGWVRSVKINKGVLLKTITGTCLDMYNSMIHLDEDEIEIFSKNPTYYKNSDVKWIMKALPDNWEENETSVNFVNKMRMVDPKAKQNIIYEISTRLGLVDSIYDREEKKVIAKKIFDMLITKDGMDFIYNHYKFYNVCLRKLCEFYYGNKIEEMAKYFEIIYGSPISKTLAKSIGYLD